MESPVTFDRLYEGAKRFASLAMEAHAEEDQEVFLLHAGVSVERLAKAALVRVHPTLLTEVKGNDEMLLYLAGAVSAPPGRLRTIGAATAIGRLRKMSVLPGKSSSEADELDGLIELRNGVAHLGTSDVDDYLQIFVATVDKLVEHTAQDRALFWGNWEDAARVALDDREDRLQRTVLLRINQSRQQFRKRFADLPEGAVQGAVEGMGEEGLTVVTVSPGGALFQTLSQCPACEKETAALVLAVDASSLLFDMELAAGGLVCRLCGFYLSSAEEVEAAGLPATVRYTMEDLARRVSARGVDEEERFAPLMLTLPVVRPRTQS
ncbi:hypothetical protein [Streptomyces sp. NPDC057429]|uniref:hypothetical protein n=1 Tax=Streptomyces sp. NPDC057429 TaxID=3346130 RepID=UPI00367600A2